MNNPTVMRHKLSELELSVLSTLSTRKIMLSGQIAALCRDETTGANLRQIQRVLAKLKDKKLVISAQMALDGDGYTTRGNVWAVGKLGLKVLYDGSDQLGRKLRYWKPRISKTVLHHTLAINSVEIALRGLSSANNSDFKLREIKHEAACWIKFDTNVESGVSLRPDLYIETSRLIDGVRRRMPWFAEVDLATERPWQVLAQCQVYIDYWQFERPATMPTVLWIVPDKKRKDSLKAKITEKFREQARIFHIITFDKLPDTMTAWLPRR
jgi:hypothetical protein